MKDRVVQAFIDERSVVQGFINEKSVVQGFIYERSCCSMFYLLEIVMFNLFLFCYIK